jgi:hypothetical protein
VCAAADHGRCGVYAVVSASDHGIACPDRHPPVFSRLAQVEYRHCARRPALSSASPACATRLQRGGKALRCASAVNHGTMSDQEIVGHTCVPLPAASLWIIVGASVARTGVVKADDYGLVPCARNTWRVPQAAHQPAKPQSTPPNWQGNCRAQHLGRLLPLQPLSSARGCCRRWRAKRSA